MSASRALLCLALAAALAGCGLQSEHFSEARQRAIRGEDADGDGVRDDVQRYALQAAPDVPAREAVFQLARAMTDAMLAADAGADDATMRARLEEVGAAVDCLYSVRPEASSPILNELEARTTDTQARVRAYEAVNARAGGQTFWLPDDPGEGCR